MGNKKTLGVINVYGIPMKTNTPLADALMLRIRDQYTRESEEQHRKRFLEMVRNGDPELREEIVKSLFAVYSNRTYR
jgi:hypothetical protein